MRKVFISLLVGLAAQSTSYGQEIRSVTIDNSNEITLISKHISDTFYIQVSLPLDYGHTNKTYPIIYVLDADRTFGLATDISRWLTFGEEVPPTIIVGISYKND